MAMKETSFINIQKIAVDRVEYALKQVTEFAGLAKEGARKSNKDRAIIVDVWQQTKRLSITLFVSLFFSIEKNIPEIVYDIQTRVKDAIESVFDYKVKNVDVTITQVYYK